ncbi:MAG: hypothetical protein ACQEVQ_10565 [Pseudomonadota bacterium]
MNRFSIIKQPQVWLPALVAICVTAYDFATRIYAPLNAGQTNRADWSYVVAESAAKAELPKSLQSWMSASNREAKAASQESEKQGVPDMPGSERLGNINARVRAIFTGTEELAIVEVQQPDEPPQTKVLRERDHLGPYIISQITNQFIVLGLSEEAQADAVESDIELDDPLHLYVFEPSKKNR